MYKKQLKPLNPNIIPPILMRTLLPNKKKHYKNFADGIFRQYMKLRYGIDSCKSDVDLDLLSIRKDLVDWEAAEDAGALSDTTIQYKTWLGVTYDDVLYSKGGVGFISSQQRVGPSMGLNYVSQNINQNIIEVNTGGCITRINLNPSIVVNQNSSFVFTQSTPSTVWDIQHNMNLIPNVTSEDTTGTDIVGIIDVIDNNRLKVYFNQPVAGKAYLS